jgi:hypothetical protein
MQPRLSDKRRRQSFHSLVVEKAYRNASDCTYCIGGPTALIFITLPGSCRAKSTVNCNSAPVTKPQSKSSMAVAVRPPILIWLGLFALDSRGEYCQTCQASERLGVR